MTYINNSIIRLNELCVPTEDSAMLLPLGMCTRIVCKHNLRNLIDMSRQRLCVRAYWEYRLIFKHLMKALSEYSEEWAYIVDNYFKPKCEVVGYCQEKMSCKRFPYKQ